MNGLDAVATNLIDKHPVSLALAEAGLYLGFPTPGSCYVSKSRGEFPVRVLRTGSGLRVMTSDLLDYIRTGESQSEKRATQQAEKRGGVGRPTSTEKMEAAGRGITIRELRAQTSLTLNGRAA